MAASSEVGTIKAAEESRPLMDQRNFQAQFNQEVDNQRSQVTQKEDVGQGELHSDAQEKGGNEYKELIDYLVSIYNRLSLFVAKSLF